MQKYFWRGYIDGDGHVGITKNNKAIFSIIGTKNTLEFFIKFLKDSIDLNIKNIHSKNNSQLTFHFGLSYNKALKVLDLLYNDSKIHLTRKKEKYEKIKKLQEPQIQIS
jgi:hypothetical protein